ncbi:aromatic acid/H+ symport family MFS transporter [Pseudarthrobacter sulfonivorans]|uniref:MFS transporter n=1 Tax=Pseudarthrobacter sulfonivorans TaxID=121292 RepID=UPI00285A4B1E|nr:aromatic acid/H+ symport family MFS transporter [Pseudarthrobacter sulfonivorans]MDR6413896.1 AAHS family benzoate transporter-like MFS transporter [Pseudarthrobacter sulfonivorans]
MKALPLSGDVTGTRTVRWVMAIAATALIFDGYDLVVYGTVVPALLRDPSQLGALDAAQAGALGSYALMGVLVGALTAGAVGDFLGRRKMMLINIVWFSVGMALTSLATSVPAFGILRFLTGIGVGALVATAGAVVAEFAPAGKRNFYNAIVYSGVPAGGLLASLLAIVLNGVTDWRGLFLIGALPLVILFPLALWKLPESPRWLQARGRTDEAIRLSARTGIALEVSTPDGMAAAAASGTASDGGASGLRPLAVTPPPPALRRDGSPLTGFAALASGTYRKPTVLLGLMSFCGLLLTYGLNTWLPEIMGQHGYGKTYSLTFLLALNAGAVVGGLVASKFADRFGPRAIVSTTFVIAAVALVLLTLSFPLPLLLAAVAFAGVGSLGTQVLVYGFVSNFYPTPARVAGVAWCAGFGRLGGIFGPLVGGFLISAQAPTNVAFLVFAAVALIGGCVTMVVRSPRAITVPAKAPETVSPSASVGNHV